MDKYIVAPPSGSTNNSVGAVDRKWKKGYFDELPNWQEYLAESTGYGIVSGCTPTISGLTVTVAAGVVHLADGTRKELSATNITLDAADTTNPRIDLVYIDSAGVVAKVTGTAAASPSAPSVPSGGISVAQVSVAANASAGELKQGGEIISVWSNMGVVNVKDYGAKGDGLTDDTLAFYNAFKSCANIVYIPKGTYIISQGIEVSSDVRIVGEKDNSTIKMNGKADTTYLFYGHDCDFYAENINFVSTADQHDASHFQRDSSLQSFSNVRCFKLENANVHLKNIITDHIEITAVINDDGGSSDIVDISNIINKNAQMGIVCSRTDKIIISDYYISHINTSNHDHTLYFVYGNNIINATRIYSVGCVGIPINACGATFSVDAFNTMFISDSDISAMNGIFINSRGNMYIDNCVVHISTVSGVYNTFVFYNVDGNTYVNNCVILNDNKQTGKSYLILSVSGEKAGAVPNTYLTNVKAQVSQIEGYTNYTDAPGIRYIENCDIELLSGDAIVAIDSDNVSAEYYLRGNRVTREPAYTTALVKSSNGGKVEICKNVLIGKIYIFDGDASNLLACDNVSYYEKGSNVTNGGTWTNNVIIGVGFSTTKKTSGVFDLDNGITGTLYAQRESLVGQQVDISIEITNCNLVTGANYLGVLTDKPNYGVNGVGFVGTASEVGTEVRILALENGKVYAYSPSVITNSLKFSLHYNMA